jgi:prohibitin 2
METRKNFRAMRLIPIGIIIAITAVTLLQSFVIIPAGSRGVVITLGKVTGVLGESFNFKTPWLASVETVDVRVRAAERNGESAGTKDLQEVTADLTVNYRLAADKVDTIFVNLGRGYESSVILPAVDESLKAVTAQFTAEEPITRRDTVKAALTDNLQSRLAVFNIEVITVSFTDFQFSDLARAPRWRIKESPEIANQQYGLSPTRYGRRHRGCPPMLPPHCF